MQAILLTELIFLIIRIKALELSISILIPAFLIYSVTLIFTLLIKFIIIGEKEKNYLKTNQLKLKRNPSLFAQHIQISERINIPQKDITFVFGELQSTITVTLFLSTTCSACSKEFDEILNLMRRNLRIRIQLIFAKPNDALSITFLRIIFVMMKAGKNSEALEMIKIWYKTAIERREKILKNTYIPEEYDDFLKMFNDSKNLFRNIQKVPTIMINGIKLPDFYSLEDIRYHIPELEKENRYSEIENKQNNRKK